MTPSPAFRLPCLPPQGAAAAPAAKRGVLGAFVSSLATRIVGKEALTQVRLAGPGDGLSSAITPRQCDQLLVPAVHMQEAPPLLLCKLPQRGGG